MQIEMKSFSYNANKLLEILYTLKKYFNKNIVKQQIIIAAIFMKKKFLTVYNVIFNQNIFYLVIYFFSRNI